MSKPYRLPSGKWFVRWFDEDGKRRGKAFTTEAQALVAARRGTVARDDVIAGRSRPRSNLTLREVAPLPTIQDGKPVYEGWLADRPAQRRRDDEGRLRVHLLPYFGDTKLGKIDPGALERFVRHMEAKTTKRPGEKNKDGKRLRPATIKNCLILLCKLLSDFGFDVRVKYTVPTQGYGWIQDAEDVARFLAACRPDWFRVAAALAVYGGLRAGEVAGLRRNALDFERGLIRVDRSYDGPVKSKHLRWVPLSPQLATILREWLLPHPGDLVVMPGDAMLEERSPLAKHARAACKRAGVPAVTFHQLRHTAASHMALRVPLPIMAAILGHSDPRTTSRYAHLDSESLARDPRMHLDFTAPDGKLIRFPSGNTVATKPAR